MKPGGTIMRTVFIALVCVAGASSAQITAPGNPSAFHPDHPKSRVSPVSLPTPVTSTAPVASTPGVEALDNSMVITLVRAGLGPEAVIAKINSSTGTYDTSTNSLIALKRAGVPDGVIAAMLTRSRVPGLANGLADNSNANPIAPHAPGIYLADRRDNGRMMRIDATMSNQMKSSNVLGFAFSYGLSSMKMKTVIPNATARVQSHDRRPVFYFYFNASSPLAAMSEFGNSFSMVASSPNEFSLIRFDQKRDHREAAVGSYSLGGIKSGVSDKARVAFTYDDVAPGVFRVMPSAELPPGQYGFLSSMGAGAGMGMIARIFDFAVD